MHKLSASVFEIVGVIADAKNQGVQGPIMPEAFIPFSVTSAFERGILLRTASAPLQLAPSCGARIAGDPETRAFTHYVWVIDDAKPNESTHDSRVC